MPHTGDKPVVARVILLLNVDAYGTDAKPPGEIRMFLVGSVCLDSNKIRK
jgi:hypothetical protein